MMLRSTTTNDDYSGGNGGGEVAALRAQINALTSEVSRIAHERAEAIKRAAEAGAEYAEQTVDDYPMTTMALAFGFGALIGLAVIPSHRKSFDWRNPSINSARDELADYTEKLKRSVRNSAVGSNFAANLERVADTVSNVDAKTTIGPVWNRLVSWLDATKNKATAAASEIASKATG